MIADAKAQVYLLRGLYGDLEARACAFQSHHSYELGNTIEYEEGPGPCALGCPPTPGTVALNGVMVAYANGMVPSSKYGDCYCGEWHIVVRDLQTGHVVRRVPTGGSKLTLTGTGSYTVPEPGNYVGVGSALDVVIKGNGSVAWIVYNAWGSGMPRQYEVHVVDHLGSRTVASSSDISPNSLALAGSTLYWTQGSKPFSTTLN